MAFKFTLGWNSPQPQAFSVLDYTITSEFLKSDDFTLNDTSQAVSFNLAEYKYKDYSNATYILYKETTPTTIWLRKSTIAFSLYFGTPPSNVSLSFFMLTDSGTLYHIDDWLTVTKVNDYIYQVIANFTELPVGTSFDFLIGVNLEKLAPASTFTYTETLHKITSSGSKPTYTKNENINITFTANEGFEIYSLTSTVGTVVISSDKKTATLTGVATDDIVVEGYTTTEQVSVTYNLQHVVIDGTRYDTLTKGDTKTIYFKAGSADYTIQTLTTTLGESVIDDPPTTGHVTVTATEDFTITGIGEQYFGTVYLTGTFTNCTCNYSNGERVTSAKGDIKITATDGYVFLSDYHYKVNDSDLLQTIRVSDDKTYLYISLKNRVGRIYLYDDYNAVVKPTALNNFVNLYKVSEQNLTDLGKIVFGSSDIDYNQYVTMLYSLPISIDPSNLSDTTIILGDYDTNIITKYFLNYLLTIDLGDIIILEKYKNAYDYINTECILRAPFFDSIALDNCYCIGQTISLSYIIDLYSGTLTLNVYSSFTNSIITSISTNISTQLPYIQGNYNQVINNLSSATVNNITTPSIEVLRNIPYPNPPTESNEFGKNTKIIDYIKNYAGYLEVENVELISSATNDEQEKILSILKSGFFIY